MSSSDALELLHRGAITIKGRMPSASNVTLLAELTLAGGTALAIYKPQRGERPLWDFPPGLYKREVAAYRLSEALGWGLVPPTILREGPHGAGSLQLFVHADFEQHYFTLLERPEHHARLQQICAFDLVANNAVAGEPNPREMLEAIERLLDEGLPEPLAALLDPGERQALRTRGKALARRGRFPKDSSGMRYPWPLV